MLKALKKIGLIGGTFDPVHNGHLHLAEQAQDFFDLEKVIFIPAFRSPHKLAIQPESCKHRLAMLALALENRPTFSMNKMEIEKQAVSFTIDTLKALKSENPDWSLFLILGADAFQAIDTWKQSSQLLNFCNILVGKRPGADFKISESVKNKLSLTKPVTIGPSPKFGTELVIFKNTKKEAQVVFFQISPLDISSKEIRRRILRKEEIKNLLPPPVDHYIIVNRLYRDDSPPKVA